MLKSISSKSRDHHHSSMMKGKESKMDSRSLEKRLSSVKETAEEIQGLARWCLQHRNHQHSIIQAWSRALRKAKVPHRLTLFYVCNEIVQNARRKKLLDVNQHFATAIKDAIPLVRDEKVRHKIVRIFNIWEERGIYDSKFIAELQEIMENVGTVNATENEVVLAGFQPIQLVEGMRAITELEKSSVSLANDLKNQHFTLTDEEIAQLRQTVKERGTSRERMEEFEEAVVALECYIASVQKEVEQRTAVITLLEQAEIFYEGLRGEAKQVAGAYKNFGNRVRNLKGKLVEKIKSLPEPSPEQSPVPSPVADAPSPENSEDEEISVPQAGGSGIDSFMDSGTVAELAKSAMKSGYSDLEIRLSAFTNNSDSPEIISTTSPKSSTGGKPYTPNTSFINTPNTSFISDTWDTPERSHNDRYEQEKPYDKLRDKDHKSKEKHREEDSWEKSVASNFWDTREKSTDRDRDSSRDRERDVSRDRDRDRDRERDRDRNSYREYEHSSSRDKERGSSRDIYQRDNSREPERGESWERERGSSRDRERSSSHDYGNAARISRQSRESRDSRDGDRDYRAGWDQESRDFLSQKSRDYSQTPTQSSFSSPANSLKDANVKEGKPVSIGMGAAELLNTFGKSLGSTGGNSNTAPSSTAASHNAGPPQLDLTRPPQLDLTRPPQLDLTRPPQLDLTRPPQLDLTRPPQLDLTRPPQLDLTRPPQLDLTRPPPKLSIPLPPAVPPTTSAPGTPYPSIPPPPSGPPPVPVPPPVPPPPVGPPPVGPPPVPVPPPGPPIPYEKPPAPPFPPKPTFPPPPADEQPPFPPYLPPNLGSNWGAPPPPPPPPNEDNEDEKEDGWRDYSSAWSDYDQYNNSQDENEVEDDDEDNRNWGEPPGTEELEALNSETPSSPPHYEQGFAANLAPPPLPPAFFQGQRSNLRELVTITDGGDTDHRSSFPQQSSNSDSDYRCYDYRSLSEASNISNPVPSIKTLFSQDDDQDLRIKKSSSKHNHDSGSDMDISGSASESEKDMDISDGEMENEQNRSKEKRKRVPSKETPTRSDKNSNTDSVEILGKTEATLKIDHKEQNNISELVAKDTVKPKTVTLDDEFEYDDIFVLGEGKGKGKIQGDGGEEEESPRKRMKSEYETNNESNDTNKDLNGRSQDLDLRGQMGHDSYEGRGWYKDFSNIGEPPREDTHNDMEQVLSSPEHYATQDSDMRTREQVSSSPAPQYTIEDRDMRSQMEFNSDSRSETNSTEPVHPIESLGGRPFRTPDTSALISVFKGMDKEELKKIESLGRNNDERPFRTPDTSALISVFKDMDKEELKRVLESTSLGNKTSSSYENTENLCVNEPEERGLIEVLSSSNNDPDRRSMTELFETSSNQEEEEEEEERGGMIEVLSGTGGNDGWRNRGGRGHFDQRGGGHRGSWGVGDNFQPHGQDSFYSQIGRGRGEFPHGGGSEGPPDTHNYQESEPENYHAQSEEQFQSWGRGRGNFISPQGRGDFNARGRGDFSALSSPRGRGDFNSRGRGDFNSRGRGDFNNRGRGEFSSPRGRGEFNSPRGRGDFSSPNRGRGFLFTPSPQTDFSPRGGGNFRGNFRGGDRGRGDRGRGFRGGMRGNAWW